MGLYSTNSINIGCLKSIVNKDETNKPFPEPQNIITGNKSSFDKKLFIVNGLNLSVDIIKTSNNPGCKVCE